MKMHIGSIQRRGNRYYLVTLVEGKQKWVALKTDDAQTAKARARRLLPPDDSECAWLRHLSRLGSAAENELRQREIRASLTWKTLWDEFLSRAGGTFTDTSETSYERWMRILTTIADELGYSPDDILKRDSCSKITARLLGAYVSTRRMLGFYRRVWRTLGLDPQVWSGENSLKFAASAGRREFYRRLSTAEIRKVHGYLLERDANLADMVLIGYSTGLRLSDVAELETREIDEGGRFLSVVPNKTRAKKPLPLRIPLVDQVRGAILARRVAPSDEDGHLFPADARHRPSRRIAAAFRSCGVRASGNGRASFHSLRATFISMMDEAGIPPHITDAITGHAGGGMHARYTQPSPDALLAAVVKAIPPL